MGIIAVTWTLPSLGQKHQAESQREKRRIPAGLLNGRAVLTNNRILAVILSRLRDPAPKGRPEPLFAISFAVHKMQGSPDVPTISTVVCGESSFFIGTLVVVEYSSTSGAVALL